MEIQYANVRLPVSPAMASRNCVPFSTIPRLGTVVRGRAVAVDGAAVTLADGRALPYDYLVLAPGVGYADPLFKGGLTDDTTSRAATAADAAAALAAASSVVIVGGGPVGVEVAGELATDARHASVTLVTSADRLLYPKPPALGAAAAAWLTARGVTIVTGATVEVEEGGESGATKKKKGARQHKPKQHTVTLSTGQTLSADIVYRCHAAAPHTGWLPAGVLNEGGFIRVDEHLAVLGPVPAPGRWFALGDACDAPGVKLGYLTRQQADVVAANIKAAAAAAAGADKKAVSTPLPAAWAANGGRPELMLVTLGRGAGTGHVGPWITLPSLAVWAIKARDLFVGKTRAGVGAPAAA